MNKITVQTTGNFMLVDPTNRCEIAARGPSTVPHTAFVTERIELGQLEIIGDAPERENSTASEGETTLDVPERDNDGDGHDDKTGNFVEGNKAARGRRGRGK
jgi:hypothetical protein